MKTCLGSVIGQMRVVAERPGDDVIDNDLILVWGVQKRIITGSDLLGRLLRNIATVDSGGAGATDRSRGARLRCELRPFRPRKLFTRGREQPHAKGLPQYGAITPPSPHHNPSPPRKAEP